MARFNISGLIDNTPTFMGERTLPYEGSPFVERNDLGGVVFDAAIEAANIEAAVDIIEALAGSSITTVAVMTDEDCEYGGAEDGYRAWGRVIGHIPMGVLRGGIREAICLVLNARGR
jgi:hypothetical protein